MTRKIQNAIKKLGWKITEDGEYYSLENWSPLGEDLYYEIPKENWEEELKLLYLNFSVDDHVADLISCRGKYGIPNSVVAIVKDAQEIEKMLEELFDLVL